ERFGDGGPGVDPLAHVAEDAPERGTLLPLEQDLERAHDREPRLQERNELLVEDQELAHLDPAAVLAARRHEREPLAADLEDVAAETLDLEPRRAHVGRDHRPLRHGAVGPARLDLELAQDVLFWLKAVSPPSGPTWRPPSPSRRRRRAAPPARGGSRSARSWRPPPWMRRRRGSARASTGSTPGRAASAGSAPSRSCARARARRAQGGAPGPHPRSGS